jgi:hypothetical protein
MSKGTRTLEKLYMYSASGDIEKNLKWVLPLKLIST